MNNIKTVSILNKLHEQERNFKRDLAKTFLEYLDSLPTNKRIEQMEALLYERNLPTLDRRLTLQESKCLYLASKGKEIKEMANILGLSQRTIKYHRANIIKKLEVDNITAATSSSNRYHNDSYIDNVCLSLHTDQKFQMFPEKIQSMIDIFPYTIFWKDKNSLFRGCNKMFAKLANLNCPEKIVGKSDYDLPWTKEESDQYIAADQEVIQNGRPKLNIEESQTFQDGSSMTLLTSKVPLCDSLGNITVY